MAMYMKGRHKLYWRQHVIIIILIIVILLINKLFFLTWHQSEEKNEITYLPTDKFESREKNTPAYKDMSLIKDVISGEKEKNRESTRHEVKENHNDEMNKDKTDNVVSKGVIKEALDDYNFYLKDITKSDIQDKFINKHKYMYTLNNEYACNGNVFILILVHSAPRKVAERMTIRNSWGSVRFYSGAVIVPMFLLAQVTQDSPVSQSDLIEESEKYRDIIQGNFIDSYRNLTNKNVMGLHWMQKHCNHTKFVLKTDDDTMVNIYHLIKFLFQKSPDGNLENFLYCSTYKRQGPRRDKSDKWYVTLEEYPYTKYPPYCEGFAYIMSNDVSKKLYETSESVKPYWIDDVYVTGFLALKAGIFHKDMERGHGYNLMESKHLSKTVKSSMFILAKYEQLRKNWNRAWSDIKTVYRIV